MTGMTIQKSKRNFTNTQTVIDDTLTYCSPVVTRLRFLEDFLIFWRVLNDWRVRLKLLSCWMRLQSVSHCWQCRKTLADCRLQPVHKRRLLIRSLLCWRSYVGQFAIHTCQVSGFVFWWFRFNISPVCVSRLHHIGIMLSGSVCCFVTSNTVVKYEYW